MNRDDFPAGLNLRDGLDLSGLSDTELWLRYVGVGGTATPLELADEIVQDDRPGHELDAHEHNLIAHALNEHFVDRDQNHPVGYREPARHA